MHIQHVEIWNFRKLQAVWIDFADETTVFVGANNSGKTSAFQPPAGCARAEGHHFSSLNFDTGLKGPLTIYLALRGVPMCC
ncbi:AAA family ATPase [Myxococcus sp. AM009]|uniref:AAA family ATPase n=1 Tax=Myxococcus sp. AM009 TaxID=2745137 RepID=UPI00159550DA|nr:AAA family ATPase [Myxococcus sp. AM009]